MSSETKVEPKIADTPQVSANSHIRDFILEYCFCDVPPQYAVLIKGPWGSGKSWFVTRVIQDIRNKGGKELYVSLYGLTTFEAIEYEFFRQLHPVLSHKGMALTGRVLKGALRATLKIDLDGDGKSDGSISPSVPDVKLPEYLTQTSGLVLIFDDVERCSIKLPDLLGYINHFVEHQDYKVILVANEAVFDNDSKYAHIKEKLVGKTFEIAHEIDSALDHFIRESGAESFFEPHRELIKTTHAQSHYGNLRHLRQAIMDFSRLEKRLDSDVTDSSELMAHLLKIFLIFTIETRHGGMSATEISRIPSRWLAHRFSRTDGKDEEPTRESIMLDLLKKYESFDADDLLLDSVVWVDILAKSFIDAKEITSQLKRSRYLVSESSPNWVKLWNFQKYTDAEFTALAQDVWHELEAAEFESVDILKHVVGLFIFFSHNGLFNKQIREVDDAAKACVRRMRTAGRFDERSSPGFRENESALGLGFYSNDKDEFIAFCDYVSRQTDEAYVGTLSSRGQKLLTLLPDKPMEFSQALYHSNSDGSTFYNVPILTHIDPEAFVNVLCALTPDGMYDATRFLKERYKSHVTMESLLSEQHWLLAVKNILEQKLVSNRGTLSSFGLSNVLAHALQIALDSLDVFIKESNT